MDQEGTVAAGCSGRSESSWCLWHANTTTQLTLHLHVFIISSKDTNGHHLRPKVAISYPNVSADCNPNGCSVIKTSGIRRQQSIRNSNELINVTQRECRGKLSHRRRRGNGKHCWV